METGVSTLTSLIPTKAVNCGSAQSVPRCLNVDQLPVMYKN